MDLSIIIPNYKSKEYLHECLQSINAQIGFSLQFEIIIVNNDENETLHELNNYFSNLTILEIKKNIGFSKASNIGANAAKGKILFFLNPDTKFLSGNILEIISLIENKGAEIIAPKLLLPDGNIQPWSCGHKITLGEIIKNNIGVSKNKVLCNSKQMIEVDWISGAAMFFKKETFEKLGGFDENFFMYFEDVDICTRAKKENMKIISHPSVEILHIGGVSKDDSKTQKTQYYASQDYYFDKHFGQPQAFLLKIFRSFGRYIN